VHSSIRRCHFTCYSSRYARVLESEVIQCVNLFVCSSSRFHSRACVIEPRVWQNRLSFSQIIQETNLSKNSDVFKIVRNFHAMSDNDTASICMLHKIRIGGCRTKFPSARSCCSLTLMSGCCLSENLEPVATYIGRYHFVNTARATNSATHDCITCALLATYAHAQLTGLSP
jgi:hypothetical protein